VLSANLREVKQRSPAVSQTTGRLPARSSAERLMTTVDAHILNIPPQPLGPWSKTGFTTVKT
jgi:hypothetical protein